MQTRDDIRNWLVTHIAEIVGAEQVNIDPRATFESFGLASRDAIGLSGDLEDWLGRRLSPTLLYQYPTIDALASHLAADHPASGPAAPAAPAHARTAELATLSDEEVEALLLEKLAQIDQTGQ